MHLAAWKSDLETIRLLVEAGKEHDVDIVNSISTGKGNYGKTRTLCSVMIICFIIVLFVGYPQHVVCVYVYKRARYERWCGNFR